MTTRRRAPRCCTRRPPRPAAVSPRPPGPRPPPRPARARGRPRPAAVWCRSRRPPDRRPPSARSTPRVATPCRRARSRPNPTGGVEEPGGKPADTESESTTTPSTEEQIPTFTTSARTTTTPPETSVPESTTPESTARSRLDPRIELAGVECAGQQRARIERSRELDARLDRADRSDGAALRAHPPATCEMRGGAKLGSSGSDVRCLEERLDQVSRGGALRFQVDSVFDEDTEAAIAPVPRGQRAHRRRHRRPGDGHPARHLAGQLAANRWVTRRAWRPSIWSPSFSISRRWVTRSPVRDAE